MCKRLIWITILMKNSTYKTITIKIGDTISYSENNKVLVVGFIEDITMSLENKLGDKVHYYDVMIVDRFLNPNRTKIYIEMFRNRCEIRHIVSKVYFPEAALASLVIIPLIDVNLSVQNNNLGLNKRMVLIEKTHLFSWFP